jgi:hypothetical protein
LLLYEDVDIGAFLVYLTGIDNVTMWLRELFIGIAFVTQAQRIPLDTLCGGWAEVCLEQVFGNREVR